MHRRQLPLAFECPRSLEEMPVRAEGRQRWCDGCRQFVHDLSMYGEIEARKLLRKKAGEQLCVAYRFDDRGAVQFRRTMLDRVGVALASAALVASAGCVGFVEMEVESQEPEAERQTWVVVPDRQPEPEPAPSSSGSDVDGFELPIVEFDPPTDDVEPRLILGGIPIRYEISPEEIERRLDLERKAIVEMAASE